MCSLAKLVEESLNLVNTDQKQINIANEPDNIFLLGYNYSKIEKHMKSFNEIMSLNELIKLIGNEDFYQIYLYLSKINNYILDEISKYTL